MLAELLDLVTSKPKLIAAGAVAIAILGVIGYGWWTYTSLQADLAAAKAR